MEFELGELAKKKRASKRFWMRLYFPLILLAGALWTTVFRDVDRSFIGAFFPAFGIYSVWCLGVWCKLRREAEHISLGESGATIYLSGKPRLIPYSRIAGVTTFMVQDYAEKQRFVAEARTAGGRRLFRFGTDFSDFDTIVDELRLRTGHGVEAGDVEREERRVRLARKRFSVKMSIVVGLVMIAIGVFGGIMILWERSEQQEFRGQGTVAFAEVVRRDHAAKSHLDVRFTDQNGVEHTQSLPVSSRKWDYYKEGKIIPVTYLPNEPEKITLFSQAERSVFFIMLAPVFFLVLGLVMAITGFLGYSIEIVNKKFALLRPGEVIEDRAEPGVIDTFR